MVYCIQQLNRSITDNDRSEEKRVNENLKRKERDGKGGGWSIISISSPQKRKKRKEKIEKAAADCCKSISDDRGECCTLS